VCNGGTSPQTGNGAYDIATSASFSWAPTATAAIGWYGGGPGGYVTGLVFTAPGTDAPGTGAVTFTGVGFGVGAALTAWTNYTLTATVPTAVGTDVWLSGALCKGWRREGFFTDQLGGTHPTLKWIVDFYCYADGTCCVDVAVEQAPDSPSNTPVTYDARVTINGVTAFTGPANVVHYPGQRWFKAFPAGGLAQVPWYGVAGGYDWSGAIAAGVVQRIDSRLVSKTNTPGTGAGWGVLPSDSPYGGGGGVVMGDLPNAAFATGGAWSYLYAWPEWAVQCLAYPGDVTSWDYLLRVAEAWGGFPCHLRNNDGTYVLDGRGNGRNGIGDPNLYLVNTNAAQFGNGPVANAWWNNPATGYTMDNAHAVNWAQLPYVVTGRRHFADELKYQCSFVAFNQAPTSNGAPPYANAGAYTRANGYGLALQAQVRSTAWAVRSLAMSASLCPDVDTEWKTFATTLLSQTLSTINGYAAGTLGTARNQPGLAPAWFGLGSNGSASPPVPANYYVDIEYEEKYIAWMVDYANGLGYAGGENKVLEQARYNVALLVNDATPDPGHFPSNAGVQIALIQGTVAGGVYTPYTTLSQLAAYYVANGVGGNNDLAHSTFKCDSRLMCLILLRRGNATDRANANAALAVLTANDVEGQIFPANAITRQFAQATNYWQ
jgi:hypothetical protein